MKPDGLWVIFNKISDEILFVYAELFMAQHKCDELCKVNVSGSMPNSDKLLVITLQTALDMIKRSHQTELADMNFDGRWGGGE